MNIKNKKLKAAVIASILAFNMGMYNNVFAADKNYVIGEGAYSWDRDWSLSLGQANSTGGGTGSSVSRSIKYYASSGLLVHYTRSYDEESSQTTTTEIILGDAKTLLGGMSEEDIKQAIDDAIHNIDGDQTVDGNQTVTGSQDVQGGQIGKPFACA